MPGRTPRGVVHPWRQVLHPFGQRHPCGQRRVIVVTRGRRCAPLGRGSSGPCRRARGNAGRVAETCLDVEPESKRSSERGVTEGREHCGQRSREGVMHVGGEAPFK